MLIWTRDEDTPADGEVAVFREPVGKEPPGRVEFTTGGGGVSPTRTITAGNGLTGGGDLSADRTIDVVANADGSIVANANDIQVGVLATDAQHGNRGGGALHADATTSASGFMSANDKRIVDSASFAFQSPVDWFTASPTADSVAAGSFTTACKFSMARSATCTGIRFRWAGATARTIRCILRDGAGVTLKSVDIAVSGAGIYSATFASSQALSIQGNGTLYSVSIWEISATEFSRWTTKPTTMPALPFFLSNGILWSNFSAWAAGNANPTNTSATEHYAVEPVLT